MGVMPKLDVLTEAVIDASPMMVYKAVLNEYSGVTHWWMPYLGFKLKGNIPIDNEGATFDSTINPTRRMKAKSSEKVTKIVQAKSIEIEFAGDFVGTEEWTFEPTADGKKTMVKHHWNGRTNRLLFSLVSPFVSMEKMNTDYTQKGFKALNSYLNKK